MADNRKLSAKDTIHIKYGKDKYYSSIIHEITKEGKLVIYTPEDEIIKLSISKMPELEVYFNREDAQYMFTAVIERESHEGLLALTELAPVSDIKRIQRREYYRLKKVIPVKVRLYKEEDGDKSKKEEQHWVKAYTVDISADGVKIRSDTKWEPSSTIELIINLESVAFKLKGAILGVKESMENGRVYLTRIKFLDIRKQQRDIIMRYIFKEQLKLRSKGLL